jgi:hypothetical protein
MKRSLKLCLSATVLIAFAIGMSCTHKTADADKAAGTQKSDGTQANASADTSACDDYFSLVGKCIGTKMPESERATEKQNVEMTRKALESPAFQMMAGNFCKEKIRSAIRQDSYDCYPGEAAKRGIQTACNLLTRAELEQIFKTSLQDGMQDGFVCRYQYPLKTWHEPFRIEVHFKDGQQEMDAARGALKFFGKGKNSVGQFVAGEAVKDVGDDAYLTMAGIEPMLAARKGDVAVHLLGATTDQMVEVARKILPRIQPEPDAKDEGIE